MDDDSEILVCSWRIVKAEPSGMFMWFDPEREEPRLVRATPPDSEERELTRVQVDWLGDDDPRELLEEGRVGPPESGDADEDMLPF